MMRFLFVVVSVLLLLPAAASAQRGLGGGGGGMRGLGMDRKQKPPKADPPMSPWTETDASYPLKVHLEEANRAQAVGATSVNVTTTGHGTILGGEKPVMFNYKTSCDGGLTPNSGEDSVYQGKWKKKDKKIELLTSVKGKTKPGNCKIDIEVQSVAEPAAK